MTGHIAASLDHPQGEPRDDTIDRWIQAHSDVEGRRRAGRKPGARKVMRCSSTAIASKRSSPIKPAPTSRSSSKVIAPAPGSRTTSGAHAPRSLVENRPRLPPRPRGIVSDDPCHDRDHRQTTNDATPTATTTSRNSCGSGLVCGSVPWLGSRLSQPVARSVRPIEGVEGASRICAEADHWAFGAARDNVVALRGRLD